MKFLIAGAITAVLAFIGTLLFKLGVHKDVHVTQLEQGPTRQVYKLHVGAYHKILPTILEVEKWVKEKGETCELSFGEYLDDPRKVDEDRLQSNGGCIVNGDYSKESLPEGLKFREIPRKKFVVATFNGSPSIAPYKVYPKAFEFFKAQFGRDFTGQVTEVYKVISPEAVDTTYYFAVEN